VEIKSVSAGTKGEVERRNSYIRIEEIVGGEVKITLAI
jgi:hypothetical protein